MKRILTLFLLLSCGFCYSQTNDSIKYEYKINSFLYEINYSHLAKCPYTVENAIKDIQTDSLKIVIRVGFTGEISMNKVRSEWFQKKYKVQFEYLGCVRDWDTETEDIDGYNNKIMEHLVNTHGEIARQEFHEIWK